MTFLVLYTAEKDINDINIISIHVGKDSVVRSARNYSTQKHKLASDIPIIPCGDLSKNTQPLEHYLLEHDGQCACGKHNTIELYHIAVVPGWIYGDSVQTELIDSYKWKNSVY